MIMSQTKAQFSRLHRSLHSEWVYQSQTDPDFGGPRFSHNLALAKLAVTHYGGQKVKDLFNQTGLGSHPELIRMFWKIGRSMAHSPAFNDNGKLLPIKKDIGALFYPGFDGDKR